MTWEMYEALVDACERVDADAAHPRADPARRRRQGVRRRHRHLAVPELPRPRGRRSKYEERLDRVLDRLERVTKPTIAQVQGVAAGGGCAIALTCDLRVATPESTFGIPIARTLGNCLSGATYSRLLDLMGPGAVKDMLFTGR